MQCQAQATTRIVYNKGFIRRGIFHSSIGFTYGYLRLTPSVLEIFKDVPTLKGLNVNSHR